jgi:four helix bundle protein
MTKAFPGSETYGMTSQIRRSSASIAANIAEGHGRENTGSFIQFLRIAQGSLKELGNAPDHFETSWLDA